MTAGTAVEYNPFAPGFYENDVFDVYRWLRDESPVYYSERWGWWALSRFDEPDGSFGFRLLPVVKDFSFGSVRPGESLEFGYDYFATASTGFGETAVFAAIGDPFDLTTGGGRFDLHVSAVPEPGTLSLIALGLAALCAVRLSVSRAVEDQT